MGTYNYYKMFGCFNRKFKISETEPPPDVQGVFSRYVEKGSTIMTTEQLLRFLVESQRDEGVCLDDAEKIMHEVHQRRHHLNLPIIRHSHSGFALEEFFYFLFQDDLNPPIRTQVHHDMTAPLQHYFIYTGHNSYLTGNQLSSDCSEIPIIKALQRGVRGIELDLWPNSAKDNIHVLHGRTLTTPVLLKNCLKSIKEHAFINSPYPVIITLEDHLTTELQAKAAEMVIKIFGDMLYYPESGHLEVLPSPEELRHRIILSTKPPKEYQNNDRETTSPGKDSSDEDFLAKDTPGDTPDYDFYEKCDRDEVGDDDDDSDTHSKKQGQLAAPENKRLAAMHGGKPIRGRTISLNPETEEVDSPSLSEQVLEKAAASDEADLVRFTQKSTMRVFQKGTRFTSPKEYPCAKSKDTERTSSLGKDSSDGDVLEKDSPGDTPDCDFYDKCDRDEVDDDDDDSDTLSQKSSQIGAPEYKRLIAIHAGKPTRGLKHALNPLTEKVNRLSLSEHLLEKAAGSHGTDLVRFTQKNILRVFPKGTRVTSSNFAPLTAWMHGAQMVAFNMQGHGKFLWLMHGMFRANGGCGYVKKPKFLLTSGPQGEVFDIKTPMPVTNTLKVNVYLGDGWRLDFSHTHFDSYSPPDFYTKMYIVGVPADSAKKRTRIIEDDWGPIWDQQFEFPLSVPELALLRIEVREHDMSEKDDFGGQTCLPVSELRPGFRAVPLYDKKGEKLRSVRLLMRFQFV